MRFELIDQVLERQCDRLVAIKCVTAAEEYLADHFPGFPVLPGVLMLETLVQAGRLLLAQQHDRRDIQYSANTNDEPLVLTEARNIRYSRMVRPGQSLRVEVSLRKQDDNGWELDGIGTVQDQVAVQGRFRLARLIFCL